MSAISLESVPLHQEESVDGSQWLFPHKHGLKEGSNTEPFRAEIEQRTLAGESCEQIAEALAAQGVQTSAKTIARQRIKWGFRKRAIRKPNKNPQPPRRPTSRALTGKTSRQARHKADITRMTQQGLSAEDIAAIMTSRGMKLTKGASTVRRLQTVWQLLPDEARTAANARHLSRKKAREQQRKEFEDYAAELQLEDKAAWVEQRMKEPVAVGLRRAHAQQLMADSGSGHPSSATSSRGGPVDDGSMLSAPPGDTDQDGDADCSDEATNFHDSTAFNPYLGEGNVDAALIQSVSSLELAARHLREILTAQPGNTSVNRHMFTSASPVAADIGTARRQLREMAKVFLNSSRDTAK